MRDNEEIMNGLRVELKRAVTQRFKRVDLDRFKAELKEHVTHYLFEHTQRSPIVIPVVNVISGGSGGSGGNRTAQAQQGKGRQGQEGGKDAQQAQPPKEKTPEEIAAEQQKRFEEMRARLLTQDARID
jgi:ribonuclease J